MNEKISEFTASGSPSVVSRAIEQLTSGPGSLNALVVPWQSDDATLTMAVTSAKGEGWAIEHTDLGTIQLTDMGNDLTHVEIRARELDASEKLKLAPLFDGFASQVQNRFQVTQ